MLKRNRERTTSEKCSSVTHQLSQKLLLTTGPGSQQGAAFRGEPAAYSKGTEPPRSAGVILQGVRNRNAPYEGGVDVKAVGGGKFGACAGLWVASVTQLSIASSCGENQVLWVSRSGAHFSEGRLCGQSVGGACRSEGLVAGEHVPDRLGEAAGDVDLSDLGSWLLAEPLLGVLVALGVDRVPAGVLRGLDQCPA